MDNSKKYININITKEIRRILSSYKLVIAFCLIFTMFIYILISNTITYNNVNENEKSSQNLNSIEFYKIIEKTSIEVNPVKFILFWTTFFRSYNWRINLAVASNNTFGPHFFKEIQCPETNCILTSNRSFLKNIYDFDAIIFHGNEGRDLKTPYPKLRSPHQKYVMGSLESPSTFPKALLLDNYFFNWTMTYKLNSDAIWPYFTIHDIILNKRVTPSKYPKWRPTEEFYDQEVLALVNNKTKMAAQFVSHCKAVSKRDELTKSLQKYIKVDVYGKCGPLKCNHLKEPCDNMLDTIYKFYFAFENDLCEDYVTEKLSKALDRMVVPVVYGGADYNRWAPPKSYINANDFKTSNELANYLIYLDKNPLEYIKYFWWKKYYEVIDYKSHALCYCDICTKLHNPNAAEKVEYYSDIKKWFIDTCNKNRKIQFK